MFNRWQAAELQRVPRLSATFITGCAVVMGGCVATHPASPTPSRAQAQVDHVNGPFVRVGAPIPIAADYPIRLSGNGQAMIVVEPDRTHPDVRVARVWDLVAVKPLSGPLPMGWLDYGLSFDGKIAFTTDHKHVWVWDVTTSRLRWTLELNQTNLGGVAISPDGTEIVAISEADKSVKVWRIGSAEPRLSINQDALHPDFDPTGKRIMTFDGFLHIDDARSGHELFAGISDTFGGRHRFDSTGRRYLILDEPGGAHVIDTATGKTLLTINSSYSIKGARWSVDSDKIVLVADHAAQIYDAATGKLERTIVGDDMFDFWVLPGGRWAICQWFKKPLEIWDL